MHLCTYLRVIIIIFPPVSTLWLSKHGHSLYLTQINTLKQYNSHTLTTKLFVEISRVEKKNIYNDEDLCVLLMLLFLL